ncbi:M56 family metallopeptidase [Thermincola ferriacetica]
MDFKLFVSQVAHPFILYVLFGTLFSYVLIKQLFRMPRFQNARAKVYMLFIPLLLPFGAFIILQTTRYQQCILTVDYNHKTFNMINQWLCSMGNVLATYITPLFLLTGALAIFKAIVSLIACNRMIRRYGFALPENFPVLFTILRGLCHKADIAVPRVLVTRDRFARSFTFGFKKPVIVLSQGLIDNLDEDELEAVLAHELAHIIRSDSILNWITVFLRDVMFFTPVMYWLFRDLSQEKEHATDDITIALSGKPLALAGALIKVWRMSPKNIWASIALDNFMPYPNFAAGEGALEGRITRIIDRDAYRETGLSKILLPLIAVAGSSLLLLYLVC